jgi:integrase
MLSDYMEYSRRTKRSTDDDKPKEQRFKTLFAGRLASDITSKEVEDFKASFLEEKLKGKVEGETRQRTPATVNHYLKFLKAVFNRAVKHGRLTYNPVRAVTLYRENNARNRCLTAEEEAQLMEKLPARLRTFVTVALHTGMRRGELRALKWEHVDFSTGTIHIPQDKAGDGRWVTMNSVAREALLSVKREQKILSPYVFCSTTGRFLWNWEREWRPALEAAEIPNFRFHDCRHTFASRLVMAGVDLYTVQRAGGWKTQVMVQRYAHLSPDHIKAAVERLARGTSGPATGTKTGTGTQAG